MKGSTNATSPPKGTKDQKNATPAKVSSTATKTQPKQAYQEQKRVTIEQPKFDAADESLVRKAMLNRIQSKFKEA